MQKQTHTLSFSIHHLEGYQSPSGGGSAERFTVDFLIDGKSLRDLLKVEERGHVSRFCAHSKDYNRQAVDVFLMKQPPESEDGAILYECSYCGDPGCGNIFVKITRTESEYVWSGFGYDQGWGNDETPQLDLESYKHIGPFTFSTENYEQIIKQAAKQSV